MVSPDESTPEDKSGCMEHQMEHIVSLAPESCSSRGELGDGIGPGPRMGISLGKCEGVICKNKATPDPRGTPSKVPP